jgi:hypothetical protein
MAAQLTLVGDIRAWRPESGHMLHAPQADLLSSMGSQAPSVVGHPDGAAPMASTHRCLWHPAMAATLTQGGLDAAQRQAGSLVGGRGGV